MTSITIEIPGSPPTPNARYGHWAQRSRVSAQWRNDAFLLALNARNQMPRSAGFPWTDVAVTYEFVSGVSRRRDADNAVASMKPVLDGIVQAGIIPDDSVHVITRFGPHTFTVEPGRRKACVRVTVTRITMAPSAAAPAP